MTAIRLGKRPGAAGTLALSSASQAEWRSHAFFYRQNGADDGVFGLPIEVKATSERDDPWERPVRILFIQNRGLTFTPKGTLDPSNTVSVDDDCYASCVDWYGNARPIFVDGRIFALIGYEIVEGRVAGDHMNSVRRLDFTPRAHVR